MNMRSGIKMFIIGELILFLGVYLSASETYGAVNPFTFSGLMTIIGVLLSMVGFMVILYFYKQYLLKRSERNI